jgi:hypothetical protein
MDVNINVRIFDPPRRTISAERSVGNRRQLFLVLDKEESNRGEVSALAHTFHTLLAAGLAGPHRLSIRVASTAPLPTDWNHGRCGVRFTEGSASPAGSTAERIGRPSVM